MKAERIIRVRISLVNEENEIQKDFADNSYQTLIPKDWSEYQIAAEIESLTQIIIRVMEGS